MTDKTKNLWFGLAAAGAVVGAALLFHWANQGGEDEYSTDELLEELKA